MKEVKTIALEKFFDPRSVAVIGASDNSRKLGHVVFKSMIDAGFKGETYAINPNCKTVLGHRTYASVLDVKKQIDQAIIVVPKQVVFNVLEECGKKKIQHVVIISSGFAEIGDHESEERLKKIAKKHGKKINETKCIKIH